MLKTNSKKARENIRAYIIEHFGADSYTDTPPEEWHEIAVFILETFRAEKYSRLNEYKYYKYCESAAFTDWCAGLPSVLDTCYYYNRSAVDDLAEILEESESEKARYTESDAERVLTYLIYRELTKEELKNVYA